MKISMFIGIMLVLLFVSGANAPSQPIDSSRIDMDSLLIERAAKNYMDSIAS